MRAQPAVKNSFLSYFLTSHCLVEEGDTWQRVSRNEQTTKTETGHRGEALHSDGSAIFSSTRNLILMAQNNFKKYKFILVAHDERMGSENFQFIESRKSTAPF